MSRVDEEVITEAAEASNIHEDILQAIISHVPLIDLVGAYLVSKSWSQAVFSSLRHGLNPLKPWLILHSQAARPPYSTSMHAYDPRSRVWIEISKPSIKYVSHLMSSHSNFLYMLSLSKLSFSYDPLNLEWDHVNAPSIWRVDPVVAKVGDFIIVAGGTCDFEENPLAVEVFDINTHTWRTCESLPYRLQDSAALTWLSIASTSDKLIVMSKSSALMHSFDVQTGHWSGPIDFRPDQGCFHSLIGIAGDRLIVIGLIGNIEKVEKVKMWELDLEDYSCNKVTEMPWELIEKLRCETFGFSSIEIRTERGIVYMYNSAKMQQEEVVLCELLNDGGYNWESVRNPVASDGGGMMRLAFTCSEIKIGDLHRGMRKHNSRFKEAIF